MAKKITKLEYYPNGKESSLEKVGKFLLVLEIIGSIACLVLSGFITRESSYDLWGENGLSPVMLAFALFLFLHGLININLFSAGSEIIKLLKKLNGLKYDGEISQPDENTHLECSVCGFGLCGPEKKCPYCKAEFNMDDEQLKKEND